MWGLSARLVRRRNKSGSAEEEFARAKETALRYISYRPRTVWEVVKKLTQKGYHQDIISHIVLFLKEYGFLDDQEFAEMWLRSRTGEKPCGRVRIYHEMMRKGIDREIIEESLSIITPEKEETMARLLVERKYHKTGFDYKKMEGFLLRRGFEQNIVRKIMDEFLQESHA